MSTHLTYKPFTQEDWYGFSGAECFNAVNGRVPRGEHRVEPLMSTLTVTDKKDHDPEGKGEALVIVDAQGVSIYVGDASAFEGHWLAHVEGPLALRALVHLRTEMTSVELLDLGFTVIQESSQAESLERNADRLAG